MTPRWFGPGALLCILSVACADPPAEARPAKATPAAPPAPTKAPTPMPAAPWSDPIPLAAGITQTHYVPVLTSGQPYTITDDRTGTVYPIKGPDLLEDAQGKPQAFPTSATEGHALAGTVAKDGTTLVLDFQVRWNTDVRTMDGSTGAFEVVTAQVHQVGDGPARSAFTRSGDYWTRSPAP